MKLRFFCDLCGTEVPRNTVRCPTCGRYFTAVQCPRCHFRGEEKDFTEGCPQCGYMKIPRPSGSALSGSRGTEGRSGGKRKARRRNTPVVPGHPPGLEEIPTSVAPAGFYRLIGVLLTLILIILLVILFLR